jgi:hypothetical protein
MKLYSVANWDKQFENNRSRKVADLSWVAIPNKHDGENYSAIISHPDGATIFAAWVLIVQVASKCQQRGRLVRDNGQPHTASTLALKTRAPAEWFAKTLEYLERHTDWLAVEEVDGERHLPATAMPPRCQSGDEEQKGTEGKEQKGTEGAAKALSPQLLALEAHGCFVGAPSLPSARVVSNVSELLENGHNAEQLRAVFEWCKKRPEYGPQSPDSLTDPSKFQGWLQKASAPAKRKGPNI